MNERVDRLTSLVEHEGRYYDIEKIINNHRQAVSEIKEEYLEKSPFEQKLMFEVILERDYNLEEYISDPDNWPPFGPYTEKEMKENLERQFNQEINCGGYALEIDACVFPGSYNSEEAVENILKTFPFVKEYDWTELGPDEYLVLYRHTRDGYGHHFVKYDDGKFTDKCGSMPVKEFEGWDGYGEGAEEAVFVVNRNHDMVMRDENGEQIWSFTV